MVSLFSFSQFSCEKLKRVAPSEAVPGFSDGVTTRYYNFYISLFFPKYLLLLIHATRKKSTRNLPLYCTIRWRWWRCAPLVRDHAETQRGLEGSRQKEYRRVAGVSTRRFDEVKTKKHEPSLKKLTFCPRARWSDVISKIVNKIKDLLVSSIKMASPDRDDRDRSRDVRRSHSPVKLAITSKTHLLSPGALSRCT